MKNTKNIGHYIFGSKAIDRLADLLPHESKNRWVVYIIDHYFESHPLIDRLPTKAYDLILYLDSSDEPKTTDVDEYVSVIKQQFDELPACIIGIGGGCALDVAKAVGNMLTNDGKAEDYQGWDLLKNPAVYKIGIPTLSGTGSESSRTCVLTNVERGIKLGMNSDYTMFDQLILDPDLTASAPRDQYFYTGMDTYFHCMESLQGRYRNVIVDALAQKAVDLTKEVFLSSDMQSQENRAKLMIASYLGGCSAGNVGVVHPFSAGLSIALGTHHCIANCITMQAMEEFYPVQYQEFCQMCEKQNIELPKKIASDQSDEIYDRLYNSSIVHEKPLANALGDDFKNILTKEKVISVYQRM